jgi:uncharacterized protein with NRDE domain
MCLLALVHRLHPRWPLIVAANRDEWLTRPAEPMQALAEAEPRILGGRDREAGGTWLAISDRSVVVGLTNKPQTTGRDPKKRSRGELPLLGATQPTAAQGVAHLAGTVRPAEFNPCWMLLADPHAAFALDLTGGETATPQALPPGIHVLENRPLAPRSAKAAMVAEALAPVATWSEAEIVSHLESILASHAVPAAVSADPGARTDAWRPAATEAACVHAGPYGTRCATLVLADGAAAPRVWHADGPPCATPFVDQTGLWQPR